MDHIKSPPRDLPKLISLALGNICHMFIPGIRIVSMKLLLFLETEDMLVVIRLYLRSADFPVLFKHITSRV